MKVLRMAGAIIAGAVMVVGAGATVASLGYLGFLSFERSRHTALHAGSVTASPTPTYLFPALTPTPSSIPEPTPGPSLDPSGITMGYGWDGVDGRMMISAVARDQGRHLDGSTWMFDGSVWTHMPTPPRAGASSGSVVAYDSKRGREVLVMISAGHTQVWEWDGSAWSQHATRHQPQLQSQNASGAYSPKLAATVVLDAGLMPPAATWLYDGTDWRSVATAHQPDAFAHLEFDRTRNSIVALSPSDFRTWQFDGTDWTPLALDGPTPVVTTGMGRQAPWVALDQQRDLWVVFGGFDGEHILSDTWTGNGSGWTKQAPKLSPTTRISIPGMDSLAWDPASNRLVLFGGQASFDGADLDDTWAWDGRSWTQLA